MEFEIYSLCAVAFGAQEPAAERKILAAHGILAVRGMLKFKDASSR